MVKALVRVSAREIKISLKSQRKLLIPGIGLSLKLSC